MMKIRVGYQRKSSTEVIDADDDNDDDDDDDNQHFSLSKIDICSREYAQLRRESMSIESQAFCFVASKKEDNKLSTRLQPCREKKEKKYNIQVIWFIAYL